MNFIYLSSTHAAARSKRSVTTEKNENELSTFDNICMDKTTGKASSKHTISPSGTTVASSCFSCYNLAIVITHYYSNEVHDIIFTLNTFAAGVYVGRIKRKVRGYALNIQRQLYSMGGFDYNNELLYIDDGGLIPRHLSLKRLYLFVIHNSSKPSLVAYYPYSQGLEAIISNACDSPSGFSN